MNNADASTIYAKVHAKGYFDYMCIFVFTQTSFIKALAQYTKRSVISIPLTKINTNQELMWVSFWPFSVYAAPLCVENIPVFNISSTFISNISYFRDIMFDQKIKVDGSSEDSFALPYNK